LAGEMFDLLGIDPKPYFSFVNSLKDKITVITPTYNVVNGKVEEKVPNELGSLISDYKAIQYYNLHDYYKYNK
jgi:hypothetical protein